MSYQNTILRHPDHPGWELRHEEWMGISIWDANVYKDDVYVGRTREGKCRNILLSTAVDDQRALKLVTSFYEAARSDYEAKERARVARREADVRIRQESHKDDALRVLGL